MEKVSEYITVLHEGRYISVPREAVTSVPEGRATLADGMLGSNYTHTCVSCENFKAMTICIKGKDRYAGNCSLDFLTQAYFLLDRPYNHQTISDKLKSARECGEFLNNWGD